MASISSREHSAIAQASACSLDQRRQFVAPLGGQLLRVAQALDGPLRVRVYSRREHRAGQWSAPRFVNAAHNVFERERRVPSFSGPGKN